MTRVSILPSLAQASPDNGIGRVIHAQHKYLPGMGIQLVGVNDDPDVHACHISQGEAPRVDVLHAHGLYWTGDPGGHYVTWHSKANQDIISAARKALAVTVPSEWVAMPFRRDMRINPTVIGHGIDPDEWQPGKNGGYILWNKNRGADVCDPLPAWELAKRGRKVVSTFLPHNRNELSTFTAIGAQPFDKMKGFIQDAALYLATTPETFGIGTVEAMAAGVPILGYRFAGTADIVEHGVTGWLVEPGDLDALDAGATELLKNRKRYSKAARQAAQRYTWERAMQAYASLYQSIRQPKGDLTVVITNHNYSQWVAQAIESALAQSDKPEKIIVVDDGSTDNSLEVIYRYPVDVIVQENQGVAAARNAGIRAADTEFITCLDADDFLSPEFVATLRPAMVKDRGLGIAYGGLVINDGISAFSTDWPPEFHWDILAHVDNPPSNCIPCCNMFRRSMWDRAGGYKQVYAPAEDTEFWVRGLSMGFTAKRVTADALFTYRVHDGSASRTKEYKPINQYHPWMSDKDYPMAAPADRSPLVRSYMRPVVSVIIPVGPNHGQYLPAALDSLIGQSFRDWEAIVVNDSGEGIPLTVYPFVREAVTTTEGAAGASNARNIGLAMAKAPLVLWLDADDYLDPAALEKMVSLYAKSGGRYVYSDCIALGETVTRHNSHDYQQKDWSWQHNIGVLMATEDARKVGGFTTELKLWEDWDFWVKCAVNGICGIRLPEPLYYYRMATGGNREKAFDNKDNLLAELSKRYADYYTGAKQMASCCGGNAQAILAAKREIGIKSMSNIERQDNSGAVVRMEYTGMNIGAVSYNVNGKVYRGGANQMHRFIDARPGDVAKLESFGMWRRVRVTVPETPAEQPAPAPEVEAPAEKPKRAKKAK